MRPFAVLAVLLVLTAPAAAKPSVPIVAALSLTGPGAYYGLPILDGARLAVEEANADGTAVPIELRTADDTSSVDRARDLAREVCATDALAEVGPALTITALTAGPAYAACGLVAIPATAHGDDVPKAPTTFQPVFNGGSMGSAMAAYLRHVLGGRRAVVLFRQDGYGKSFAEGFGRAASDLSVAVVSRGFSTDEERAAAVSATIAEADHSVVALGMLNADAVPILVALRRAGVAAPVLAPSAIGGEDFVNQFEREPEERRQKGFFTEKVYAASPILFDSANADNLAFAARFRDRYHREPSWPAVQGYDSARLAIQAVRRAAATDGDLAAKRGAARETLVAMNGPGTAFPGVTGPIWFMPDRRREQPVRVGLFHNGLFDTAPIQLVPVLNPSKQEIDSGEVFEALPGRFVRKQRVVYTGVFINEIPRVDLPRSSFNVDFYVWMRFAESAGPLNFDPTEIRFEGMSGNGFARASPADQRVMPDGTTYRLWHVEGEVRNEFDFHRFPFDHQDLRLSFFNARADANRVVYVLDRESLTGGGMQAFARPHGGGDAVAGPVSDALSGSVASAEAFRQLTQWTPVFASERRENLVTSSPLGYPKELTVERGRELSGFVVDLRINRKALATASKTLLPLLIMTIIMFASLYFPHGLVKEKVTVAITAALSGAVLLTSVNTQLGSVGYTIAAEYVFYVFFGLALLCVMTVLVAERLRVAGSKESAVRVERWAKVGYAVAVMAVLVGAGLSAGSQGG